MAWQRCNTGIPLNDKWSKAVRSFTVLDAATGAHVPGSPMSFSFGDDSTQDKWPALVRAKLAASPLGNYLRLGTETAVDGDIDAEKTVDFWRASIPLRINIGGFEETDKAATWSCALRRADGTDATLAQMMEAFVHAPAGGTGKRRVRLALRDKSNHRDLHHWECELNYKADADNLLTRVDELVSSISKHIQITHVIHDCGKAVSSKSDKKQWTLSLPSALELELKLSQVAGLSDDQGERWIACNTGIPLNDKWSKTLRVFQVYDDSTGTHVPGSPLSFSFGDDSTHDKWPRLVRAKLAASPLGNVLRLGTRTSVDGDIDSEASVDFWHADKPLRVFIGGFEEVDKVAAWSCALQKADGTDATLADLMDAVSPAPGDGTGSRQVKFELRDKISRGVVRSWACELPYAPGEDNLLARIEALADSIASNIQVEHAIHDKDKPRTSKLDKKAWTLSLPTALLLQLSLSGDDRPGSDTDHWLGLARASVLGIAESANTLSDQFSQHSVQSQVYEYVIPLAEQGMAILVRRTCLSDSQNLGDSRFTSQPALDLDLSTVDLAAYREAWMGVLSLADPGNRQFTFRVAGENGVSDHHASATLCSLAHQLPNRDAWVSATLHGTQYLTFEHQGETILLPAPDAGFKMLALETPVFCAGNSLQSVLLILTGQDNAADEALKHLLVLPAVWPSDSPALRCNGIALLNVYINDDESSVQLHENRTELPGYTHGGQIVANVQQTLPAQLYALIEANWGLESIQLSIYDTLIDRQANLPEFLNSALPGWALPPAPLLFNWSGTPDTSLDDWLPNTVGFDYATRPSASGSWTSSCYLLADRSLAIGETLHVFAQLIQEGAVVEKVSLRATQENHHRDRWPKALAEQVNATLAQRGARLQIGADATGVLKIASDTPDSNAFAALDGDQRDAVNRLWSYGDDVRVSSTAPFMANLACALTLPSTDLLPDTRLHLQVRDATSQRLLETHLFTAQDDCLEAHQWPQALGHFINSRSEWLKAGRLFGPSAWVIPYASGNGIWVPQESNLSVTIEPLYWQKYTTFSAQAPFEKGQRLTLHVHDPVTGTPMPGSPLIFSPDPQSCIQTSWPAALAKALMQSPLADYLRLGKVDAPGVGHLDEGETSGVWWTPNLPLRIWFDGPQVQALDWQAVLADDGQPLLLSSLYRAPFSAVDILFKDRRTQTIAEYLAYTPEITGQAHDKASWCRGLYHSLRAHGPVYCAIAASKPGANRWDGADSDFAKWQLWIPRQADMEMVVSVTPQGPVMPEGQWPVIHDYAGIMKEGKEYLIHASDASTGKPASGSPVKFVGTAANKEPLQWAPALTALLNSKPWGQGVLIAVPDPDKPHKISFSNSSSDVLVALDPAMLSTQFSEALTTEGSTPALIGEWYKTPATAITLESNANVFERVAYVPAADGSVTDKRSWLQGFYNALFCQAMKQQLDFIAVSKDSPAHAIWDFTEPDTSKIWLRQGSGRLTINYLKHSDNAPEPSPVSTPGFSDPCLVQDILLQQGSLLAGIPDLVTWTATTPMHVFESPYRTSAIKAEKSVITNLVELSSLPSNLARDDVIFNLKRRMTSGSSLYDSLLTLPKLHADTALRTMLEKLDAGTLQEALQYRLNLDEGQRLHEPSRWLIHFDGKIRSLAPLQCSGRELSALLTTPESPMVFTLRLLPEVFKAGVRLLFCQVTPDNCLSVGLYLPDSPAWPVDPVTTPVPLASTYFTTDSVLNHSPRQVSILPPLRGQVFKPQDTLCADYSNTTQSEVYDVSGVVENGVDPRTGLFHAHYPIATVQGVEGLGPVLELNIHYSARRANEGALGDGWAFRFSSFDNRLRLLTLGTGQTIQLSAAEIYQLCKTPQQVLDKGFCQLSQGVADGDLDEKLTCLSSVTITYLSHRVEVLAKPETHDGEEASESYRKAIESRLNTVKANLTHWIDNEDITDEQSESFKASRTAIEENLRDVSRKAFILTTKNITSPQGGSLGLKWQGWKGHVRLLSVHSGERCLVRAAHEQPVSSGRYSSTFAIWPGTAEAYEVTLAIEDCLLRTLVRRADEHSAVVQQVHYGYQNDQALDRVLCSIREEDGSLEVVSYEPQVSRQKPDMQDASPGLGMFTHRVARLSPRDADLSTPLPRVVRHTVVPGAGQETISHRWHWSAYDQDPRFGDSSFTSTETLEVHASPGAPFTQRIWGVRNGMEVPVAIVEETPGSLRRTTTNTYPTSTEATDDRIKSLLLSQPIATEITYEDISEQAAREPQS
ncbi:hypothetical protein IAE35_06635 [Pseudomonas sp. S75]|uniref:hypothetical protein n=1 Tax=unclassified Pseudomonas TaxID=196821 RepID=UPI00190775E1|nr:MULTISPECIES: hypothetical protein [unclassified Pseudomonas]MBJ9975175.1 hypothetical protein [Pseudomonas sp. S30]MBK0153012.1 hypothetical protein [Pseudomonas sp. S75]